MLILSVPDDVKKLNIFGRYIKYWEKQGWVKVSTHSGNLIKVGKSREVVFWPWPTRKHKIGNDLIDVRDVSTCAVISANYFPENDSESFGARVYPSFFWARDPFLVERLGATRRGFYDREIESIFVGKANNNVQRKYRDGFEFSNYIELFSLTGKNEPYPFTQAEYLKKMINSRFCLSLRGYGQKCNRELEALGLGCILLVNSDVDVRHYHNPLVENVHFIKYRELSDIKDKINKMNVSEWEYMSRQSVGWYKENSSLNGSFEVLKNVCEVVNEDFPNRL